MDFNNLSQLFPNRTVNVLPNIPAPLLGGSREDPRNPAPQFPNYSNYSAGQPLFFPSSAMHSSMAAQQVYVGESNTQRQPLPQPPSDSIITTSVDPTVHPHAAIFEVWHRQRLAGRESARAMEAQRPSSPPPANRFCRNSSIIQRGMVSQGRSEPSSPSQRPVASTARAHAENEDTSELEACWMMLKVTFDGFFDAHLPPCSQASPSSPSADPGASFHHPKPGRNRYNSQQLYTAVFAALNKMRGPQLYATVHRYILWRVLNLRDCILMGTFLRQSPPAISGTTAAMPGAKRVRSEGDMSLNLCSQPDDSEVSAPIVDPESFHVDTVAFSSVGRVTDWAEGMTLETQLESFLGAVAVYKDIVTRMGSILLHLNNNFCVRKGCRSTSELAALAFAQHIVLTPSFTNSVAFSPASHMTADVGRLAGLNRELDGLWAVFGMDLGPTSPCRKRQYNPVAASLLKGVTRALTFTSNVGASTSGAVAASSSLPAAALPSATITFDPKLIIEALLEVTLLDNVKAGSEDEAQRLYKFLVYQWFSSYSRNAGSGEANAVHSDRGPYHPYDPSNNDNNRGLEESNAASPHANTYTAMHAENDSCFALIFAVPFYLTCAYSSMEAALDMLYGTDGKQTILHTVADLRESTSSAANFNANDYAMTSTSSVEELLHTLPRKVNLLAFSDFLLSWRTKALSLEATFVPQASMADFVLVNPLLPYQLLPRIVVPPPPSSSCTDPVSLSTLFPVRYDQGEGSLYYLLSRCRVKELKKVAAACFLWGEGQTFRTHLEIMLNAVGCGILFSGGTVGGVGEVALEGSPPITAVVLRAAAGIYISEHPTAVGVAWLTAKAQSLAAGARTPGGISKMLSYLTMVSNPLCPTYPLGSATGFEAAIAAGSLPTYQQTFPHVLNPGTSLLGSRNAADSSPTANEEPSTLLLLISDNSGLVPAMVRFYQLCRSLMDQEWVATTSTEITDCPTTLNGSASLPTAVTTANGLASLSGEDIQAWLVFRNSTRLLSPSLGGRALGEVNNNAADTSKLRQTPSLRVRSPDEDRFHLDVVAGLKRTLKVVLNRDASLPVLLNHTLDSLISLAESATGSSGDHKEHTASLSSATTVIQSPAHQQLTKHHFADSVAAWCKTVFDIFIALENGDIFETVFSYFLAQRLLRRYKGHFLSRDGLEQALIRNGKVRNILDALGKLVVPSSPLFSPLSMAKGARGGGGVRAALDAVQGTASVSSHIPSIFFRANVPPGGILDRDFQVEEELSRLGDADMDEEVSLKEDGGAVLGRQTQNTLTNLSGRLLPHTGHEMMFINLLRFFVGTSVTSKIDSMFGDCRTSEEINKEFRRRYGIVPPVAVRSCWMLEYESDPTLLYPATPFLGGSAEAAKYVNEGAAPRGAALVTTPHTLIPLHYDIDAFVNGTSQTAETLDHEARSIDATSNPYKKKGNQEPSGGGGENPSSSSSNGVGEAQGLANPPGTPLLKQLIASPVLPHAMYVSVLTRGLWPTYATSSHATLPLSATRSFQVFKKYYLNKFSNRRLELCSRLGNFEMTLSMPTTTATPSSSTRNNSLRKYDLLVPTQCAPVLLLFDEYLGKPSSSTPATPRRLKVKEICALVNQSERDVVATVEACIFGVRPLGGPPQPTSSSALDSGKHSLLRSRGCNHAGSITADSEIEFNVSFYNASQELGIGFLTPPLLTTPLGISITRAANNNNAQPFSSQASSSSVVGRGGGGPLFAPRGFGGVPIVGNGGDGGEGCGSGLHSSLSSSSTRPSTAPTLSRATVLDRAKRTQVSVTIVRLLKQQSPMPHSVLLERVQSALLVHFSLSVEDFKKEVDVLMQKQFVARVDDSSVPSYRYLV